LRSVAYRYSLDHRPLNQAFSTREEGLPPLVGQDHAARLRLGAALPVLVAGDLGVVAVGQEGRDVRLPQAAQQQAPRLQGRETVVFHPFVSPLIQALRARMMAWTPSATRSFLKAFAARLPNVFSLI
jgi:hypothetical protein